MALKNIYYDVSNMLRRFRSIKIKTTRIQLDIEFGCILSLIRYCIFFSYQIISFRLLPESDP